MTLPDYNPSDFDLNKINSIIAEKVMGWNYHDKLMCWVPTRKKDATLDDTRSKREWNPTTSIADATEMENEIDILAVYENQIVVHRQNGSIFGLKLREIYVSNLIRTITKKSLVQTLMSENNWFDIKLQSNDWWAIIHATPFQRCIAALLTVHVDLDDASYLVVAKKENNGK